MRRALIFAACLFVACGPNLPPAYVRARTDAEQAYGKRNYEKSAEYWLKAADSTERRRDKIEAQFRAAASYERAGRIEEAKRWYSAIQREPEPNERRARVTFVLAELEIRHGSEELGYAALEAAARKYPSSGLARAAFLRVVEWRKAKSSPEATLQHLEKTAPSIPRSDLHQTVLYIRAKLLVELGKARESEKAYLELATLYPYPEGSYWDDALLAVARSQEARGDYSAAIATMNRMLAERESSLIYGSYERTLYAQAQFRIAELYRDKFEDPARARRAFRQVFDEYPTSTLRDDALWQEALIGKQSSDTSATCAPLSLLVEKVPDSRFTPCARSLCPSLPALPKSRACHAYILRDIAAVPSARTDANE